MPSLSIPPSSLSSTNQRFLGYILTLSNRDCSWLERRNRMITRCAMDFYCYCSSTDHLPKIIAGSSMKTIALPLQNQLLPLFRHEGWNISHIFIPPNRGSVAVETQPPLPGGFRFSKRSLNTFPHCQVALYSCIPSSSTCTPSKSIKSNWKVRNRSNNWTCPSVNSQYFFSLLSSSHIVSSKDKLIFLLHLDWGTVSNLTHIPEQTIQFIPEKTASGREWRPVIA